MKLILAGAGMILLVGCQSSANMTWIRTGYGPELDVAKAQCEIMSMSVEQGVFAWGSPGYVLGAELGNAIGNEIRKAEFVKRCMIIKGWSQAPAAHASMKTDHGAVQKSNAAVKQAKAKGQPFPKAPGS